MKFRIFVMLVFCLFFIQNTIFAQNPYAGNTMTINGRVYVCKKLKGWMSLYNQSNDSNLDWKLSDMACLVPEANYVDVKAKINEVFSSDRRLELSQEKVVIIMYINPKTGNIFEVYFRLDVDSKITPQEIYTLEDKLKTLIFTQKTVCHPMQFMAYKPQLLWD